MSEAWFHGCRASRDGGTWDWYRDDEGYVQSRDAMWRMLEHLTEVERRSRVAEFMVLMNAAEKGKLRFGTELSEMSSARSLLEIRWKIRGFQSEVPPVLLRLFFAEPWKVPNALWSLVLYRKVVREENGLDLPAEAIKKGQQDAIDEAESARMIWLKRVT